MALSPRPGGQAVKELMSSYKAIIEGRECEVRESLPRHIHSDNFDSP
jgi:hypothetical protein